jgi:hypothetical protein
MYIPGSVSLLQLPAEVRLEVQWGVSHTDHFLALLQVQSGGNGDRKWVKVKAKAHLDSE